MGNVKTTLCIDEDLWRKFSILVIKLKGYRKKNKVIEQLIREYVEALEENLEEEFRREAEAFAKMKRGLLRKESYKGKFVAIYKGDLIDCDKDLGELAKRVYGKFGYVPIYMDKVVEEEEVLEIPSPEIAR